MASMRHWLALSAVAALAGGCQILWYALAVPAVVAPGRVFTMRLSGLTSSTLGQAGVVFQVPNGFTVLGASVVAGAVAVLEPERDNSALLALYTPDPGHHLASFNGFWSGAPTMTTVVELRVYVQAPPSPGAYQFEMALAAGTGIGGFVPQLGLTSFQAPGGSAVRQLQVSATPAPPPFALSTVLFGPPGLPNTELDLAAADIDGDGRDDLVSLDSTRVTVRRSIPGGFAPGTVLLPAGGSLTECALADFDGDGFVDIALSSGTVLFGDGGTTWTPVAAGPTNGTAVDAGDVDGDGLADLAWSDGATFAVLRGQANRTFLSWNTGLSTTAPTAAPWGIQVVDLDADGRAEIVVVQTGFRTRVYGSTPAGVWSLVGFVFSGADVLVIDVDGNGTKELLPSGAGQLLAYTPAGLVPAGAVPGIVFSKAVALDFDRDGSDDLALGVSAPTLGSGPPRMELWRNTGGTFQLVTTPSGIGFDVLRGVKALVAADLDDDTFPDLCAVHDDVLLAWHNSQQGVAPYGEACAAPGSAPPALSVLGSIAPGQSAVLQLANAAPLGGALLWLGTSRTLWNGQPVLPLELGIVGAPGCTLLAEPLAIVGVVANGSGVASVPFTVPLFAPTAEVALFAQGAALAPGANPFGAVFSGGLALKIQ